MEPTVKHDQNVPDRVLIDFDTRVVGVPYTEIPSLITALRRAYNARPGQPEADGVVASILLQSAVAEAPGDFS